jgi:hypothetical protein
MKKVLLKLVWIDKQFHKKIIISKRMILKMNRTTIFTNKLKIDKNLYMLLNKKKYMIQKIQSEVLSQK